MTFKRLLCTCTLLLLTVLSTGHAADTSIHDQWFNGYFDEQPAINAHEQIVRRDDGSIHSSLETTIVISRSVFGISSTLKIIQRRSFIEDRNGTLISFLFEDEENGSRTSAIGTINGKTITATLTKPTTRTQQTLVIPDDIDIMGAIRGQQYLTTQSQNIGDVLHFTGIELLSGRIILSHMTATHTKKHSNGDKTFSISMDILPMFTMISVFDRNGHTRETSMPMGFTTISIRQADGPMQLEAANIDITKVINAQGAPPSTATNTYRINTTSVSFIAADPFQTNHDDCVTVTNTAHESILSADEQTGFLNAELQLETADPQLRTWAHAIVALHSTAPIAEQAELLRLAVRSHITTKDLSQGDASALETFHSRCGDCTEHANLLCAALRINNIPARSEVGFVFAPTINSWVGHAWVSAYDAQQKKWIHLDAAYPGIPRSNYIKTASTSGDASTAKALTRGMGALLGQTITVLPSK